jgi:hypothetical protein
VDLKEEGGEGKCGKRYSKTICEISKVYHYNINNRKVYIVETFTSKI